MEDNNQIFHRRSFIGRAIAATGVLLLSPYDGVTREKKGILKHGKKNQSNVFVSESGMLGTDNLFVLGVLQVDGNKDYYEQNINSLRKEHSYRNCLTYRSNDRYKLDFSRALIQYFFLEENLNYSATIFKIPVVKGQGKQKKSLKLKIQKQLDCYEIALKNGGLGVKKNTHVWVKSQSPFGPSHYFKNSFAENNAAAKLNALTTRDSNLLQLADILTGSIRGDIMQNVKNPIKLSITQAIKDRIDGGLTLEGVSTKKIRTYTN